MENTRGGFLVSQVKQVQGRIFERLLKEAGIEDFNGPQGRILYVLWGEDNLPISELGRRTSLAKTTLTSMLDRMEEKGHILRVFDAEDRRLVRIRLTDGARKLDESYRLVSQKMAEIFYKGFSGEEIGRFESDLGRILENLKEWE